MLSERSRWSSGPATDLLWRCWDDEEYVVYHVPSGDTHLLNRIAAAALQALQEKPRSIPELAERLEREFHSADPGSWHAELMSLVAEFDELGLIRSFP